MHAFFFVWVHKFVLNACGTTTNISIAHTGSFALGMNDFAGHLWKPWQLGRSPWKRRCN